MTIHAAPTSEQMRAIKQFTSALDALNIQVGLNVFDPLEIHCSMEDLKESFAEVLATLEVKPEPAANAPQLPPAPNDHPAIADLVIADMQARKELGTRKYGTPLQAHNGRDSMMDLYQELLDACVYARQVIEERNP